MTSYQNEQAMIFNLIAHIDYSKSWEEIEHDLGYDLGDYSFPHKETYELVKLLAKTTWAILNKKMDANRGVIGTLFRQQQ